MPSLVPTKDYDSLERGHVVDLWNDDLANSTGRDQYCLDGFANLSDRLIEISGHDKAIILKFLREFCQELFVLVCFLGVEPNDPGSVNGSNIKEVLIRQFHHSDQGSRQVCHLSIDLDLLLSLILCEFLNINYLKLEGRHKEHLFLAFEEAPVLALLEFDLGGGVVFTTGENPDDGAATAESLGNKVIF